MRLVGPLTSFFLSGHAASDLAFTFAASKEIPLLFIPLSSPRHSRLSLVSIPKLGHYPSDVLVGGALGIVVAMVSWKLWPVKATQRARRWLVGGSEWRDGPG